MNYLIYDVDCRCYYTPNLCDLVEELCDAGLFTIEQATRKCLEYNAVEDLGTPSLVIVPYDGGREMSKPEYIFQVTLDLPPGVSAKAMREYIEEAIATMKGSLDPDSPIFDFDGNSVRVKSYRVERWTT